VTGILVILAVSVDQLTPPEAAVSETRPLLEARGLVKRYGQVVALDGADFELYPDEIVAVIGDNGAGKSTLIKALSGALQPDSGEIRLDGKPVRFRSPGDSRSAGIETVYQDLAVAPSLDIASNIFLGREARRRGPFGLALRIAREAHDAPRGCQPSAGAEDRRPVDATTRRGPLRRQRQGDGGRPRGEVGAAGAIMDEPTAALGVKETRQVIDLILPGRERGPAGDPDQPRHAARVRARGPDSDHAARQARRVVTPHTHTMPEAVAIHDRRDARRARTALVKDARRRSLPEESE
jgi:fructose transport system ATP-binding protein